MSCTNHTDYIRLLERYNVLKDGLFDTTALEDEIQQLKSNAKEKDAIIAELRLQLTEQRERCELLRENMGFKMVQQSNPQFGNNFGGPPTLSLQAPPYSPITSAAAASVISILPSDSASNLGLQIQPLTKSRPPLFLFPSPASSRSADGAASGQGHGNGRGQGGEMLPAADMEDQELETASSILSSLANNLNWEPFQPTTQLNNNNINRGRGKPTCEFVIIRLPIIQRRNKIIIGAAAAAGGYSTRNKYVVAKIHEQQKINVMNNNTTKTVFRYEYL